jgi:drug/metabolite transporter (DMT)-like permease
MGALFLTAILWGLGGVVLVAIGKYDDMPPWFQIGSGASIFVAFMMIVHARRND